jgi:hypothetical protein
MRVRCSRTRLPAEAPRITPALDVKLPSLAIAALMALSAAPAGGSRTLGLKPNATSRLKGRHWAQDCHRLLHKRFDQVE